MSVFIYPYKQGSKSAIALAQGLQCKLIKLENSKFKPNNKKTVINWGSLKVPEEFIQKGTRVLNPPHLVRKASNKAEFFKTVSEAPEENRVAIPEFTFDKQTVVSWFQEGTKLVFARTVLNGHSGEGIVKLTKEEEVDDRFAEGVLFVKYIPKKREFRIHATKAGPFIVQEKLKKKDIPNDEVDFQVRNAANGFVFARANIEPPQSCIDEAVKTINLLGLDFAAMDIIYNERQDKSYVLEANTAPGLEGSTIEDYVSKMKELVEANDDLPIV